MPSFSVEGFEIHVRPRDHPPPHVHVFKAEGEAKIRLGTDTERPKILGAWEMSNKDLIRALKLVGEHEEQLLQMWRQIHGEGR